MPNFFIDLYDSLQHIVAAKTLRSNIFLQSSATPAVEKNTKSFNSYNAVVVRIQRLYN